MQLSSLLYAAAFFTHSVFSLPLQPRSIPSFTSIICFGDSYSDNGNGAYKISNHTWPSNPHYSHGRFSNGPTYIENIASNLSLPLHDYAVGGATTSNTLIQGYTGPASMIPVPSIDEQIASFLASPPASVELDSSLVVILGGANDIFFDPNITASQSVSALLPSIHALQSRRARQILMLNYPDLSLLPYDLYISPANKTLLHSYSVELGTLLSALSSDLPGIGFLDLMPLFAKFAFYEEPQAYGFEREGSYGSCLTGVYGETGTGKEVTFCGEEVEGRVWFDEYHPTGKAHEVVGREVVRVLGGPFA